MGWEWEIFLAYGNSHMWESYGKSSFPHVRILWEFEIPTCGNPMGNRHFHMSESCGKSSFPHVGILWEFPQKSCGNGMGMGMKISFPRQPCSIRPEIAKFSMYKYTKMFEVFSIIPYGVAPAICHSCHMWLKWHKLKSGCILTENNGNA